METIKIKYFSDKIEKLTYVAGKSDWIDLRAAEDITMKQGEFKPWSFPKDMRHM